MIDRRDTEQKVWSVRFLLLCFIHADHNGYQFDKNASLIILYHHIYFALYDHYLKLVQS